ncbi:MAG: LicD family protein [Bacteroidales bacterium]|nr:LicD family protein [Bacteroidales bacterium]
MDNEILKKIQQSELYILTAFDRVCKEHGLTYFLDSGTALGAVRHAGFIPWDDDVDVGMPRKDYETLMRLGQDVFPSNLFLQNKDTEPSYKRNCAKLRLEGTFFQEVEDSTYIHNGMYIDIFPFDNLPSNKLLAHINVYYSRILNFILRSWRINERSHSVILNLVRRFVDMMSIERIAKLEKYYLNFCRKREKKETHYSTCYFWRMTQSKNRLFENNRMFPTKDIEFNGQSVQIMNDPDYYLTKMYGNYWELPPEDKRTWHLKGKVSFA